MKFIEPIWPAPKNVKAYSSTRQKGSSPYPFASFNLAHHVGDDPQYVDANRELLKQALELPSRPIWMEQIHSSQVIMASSSLTSPVADAVVSRELATVCAIMTADCLPILLCNRKGTIISAIHAGWRGQASGIIENTIRMMDEAPEELIAWLGPAIGPNVYEVSKDVFDCFTKQDPKTIDAFVPKPQAPGKWLANLYSLATMRLEALGVTHIFGGDHCTFTEDELFFSFRRDSGKTGRMATLIWLST